MGGGFSERNSMEAGFNNEVAILNFLGEHVFTNEVAIYLEWDKIFVQRKQSWNRTTRMQRQIFCLKFKTKPQYIDFVRFQTYHTIFLNCA